MGIPTHISSQVFVNRESEMRSMDDVLYQLTSPDQPLRKAILEFNGIGGIGKSTLLQKFSEECKTKKELHSSFIDFLRYQSEQNTDLNRIIAYIVTQIVTQIDIKNEQYHVVLDSAMNMDEPIEALTPYLIHYLRLILRAPQKQIPLVLVFDSVDIVDVAVRNWLITLVERTIDAGKILFVFASKIALGFSKSPSLERRAYSFQLKEFDQQFTSIQIKHLWRFNKPKELDDWARAIFQMTKGHPLANKLIIDEVRNKKYHPENITLRKNELIQQINTHVVTEKIFNKYSNDEIARYRDILTPLSIPRRFNLVSLRYLIEKFAPQYALISSWHYSIFIRELQSETSFVRYSKEKSGYIVDPILRNVFSTLLKSENPQLFKEIHSSLIQLYNESILNAKGTDKTKFFLEKVYHQLSIGVQVGSLISQFEEFVNFIEQNINEEQRHDTKQQFIEEFSGDLDIGSFFNAPEKKTIVNLFDLKKARGVSKNKGKAR